MNLRQQFNNAKKAVAMTVKQSVAFVKGLFKNNKVNLKHSDFKPGTLMTFSYNAKDKTQVYDRTPFVLILRRGKSHTLGLNFHWAPMPMRIVLVNLIIKLNKRNIKNNKPLEFDYKRVRNFLKGAGYAPLIRRYINGRISSKGAIVPSSELMNAAKVRSESFTGGKMSAEQLYKKATKRK